MAAAWEAVSGKVVEVVAADVEKLRLGRKATWNFGVAPSFASGVLGFNLEEGRNKEKEVTIKELVNIYTSSPIPSVGSSSSCYCHQK